MNFHVYLILFFIVFQSFSSSAQFVFNRFDNVPIVKNNKELKYPWAGGLNNPQFSEADLNNDGILDLVVFNRSSITEADKVLTFINGGRPGEVDYIYDPSYEDGFMNIGPDSLKLANWLLLIDFDCDGIPDAFSGTQPGRIHYYKGRYENNRLTFKHRNYLKFNSHSGPLNIFVSGLDIPAIVDMNFDGDLDIVTFGQFGTTMYYYENLSVETYGQCQENFIFEEKSDCWAHIVESGTIRAIEIDTSCGFNKGAPRHSGSSLLGFDQGNDKDIDFIMGNISFPNLLFVENGCNKDSACIVYQDTLFPSYNVPFESEIFGIAFLADVNNDGLKDLLAAPNQPKKSANLANSWYYKNIGDSSNFEFELVTDSFLTNQMIDLGEGASPVFVDVNQDGRLDILVGNYGYYKSTVSYKSTLTYLENIGTDTSFAFEIKDLDFANISRYNIKGIHPTFGDLDGDGDLDLLIGDETGFIHYLENTAGAGNPMQFAAIQARYFAIDIGSYSTPFLYDADNDGDLDLIIGERDGILNYFRNTGTPSAPVFNSVPDNGFLGEVNMRLPGFFRGHSAPFISKLDTSNTVYLLSGSQQGIVKVYVFDPDSLMSGKFDLVYETYSNINVGENSTIAVADLDSDNRYEMVVGNYRGGLNFFSQGDSVQIPDTLSTFFVGKKDLEGSLKLYPNPAKDFVHIEWEIKHLQNKDFIHLQIFDSQGKSFYNNKLSSDVRGGRQKIDLSGLSSGLYLIQINTGSGQISEKLLKY